MKTIATNTLLLLLLLTSNSIFGQNIIIGRVTDKITGIPIEGVQVEWWGGNTQKANSDQEGIFRLEANPDSDFIIFTKPGKKNRFEPASKELLDSMFWELDVQLENQDPSSSTATGWETSVYEIPASTVIIDKAEIQRKGYMTLNEILENVPGFYTIDLRSDAGVSLGVRGEWEHYNQNVMIQVNGVSMLSERNNDFPLYQINVTPESISRIEIVRGPSSVIYGAGAFYAVVNIITLDPHADEVSGLGSVSIGSQNTFNQKIHYGLNKNGILLSLTASNSQRDGFQQAWDAMISKDYYEQDSIISSLNSLNTTTAYDYKGSTINHERYSQKNQLINFAMRFGNLSADVHYTRTDMGYSSQSPGPMSRNDRVSESSKIQLGYSGETKEKHRSQDYSFSQFKYSVLALHRSSITESSFGYALNNSTTLSEDKIGTYRIEANTLWIIKSNEKENKLFSLTSGGVYNNNYQNYTFIQSLEFQRLNWYIGLVPKTSLETNAAYSQFDAKFNNLHLVLGGRLEKERPHALTNYYNEVLNSVLQATTIHTGINDTNARVNIRPRASVLYKFNEKENSAHYLRALYSKAIKQPFVIQNANDILPFVHLPKYSYLTPEKIHSYELGYTFNYTRENYALQEKSSFLLNVNLFRNELLDLIDRKIITDNVTGNFNWATINQDSVITNGLEIIIKGLHKIPRGKGQMPFILNVDANLTFQNSSRNLESIPVSFSPNILAGANASVQLGDARNKRRFMGSILFSIGMNYVGSMHSYYEEIASSVPHVTVYEPVGEETEGYSLWSCNVRVNDLKFIQRQTGGFYLNLHASNLFDKQYFYPTHTINSWADLGMLGRSRQILGTIGYKF